MHFRHVLRRASVLTLFAGAFLTTAPAADRASATPVVEVVNHHPFPLRMPVQVKASIGSTVAPPSGWQQIGDEIVSVVDVAAGGRTDLRPLVETGARLVVTPENNGVRVRFGSRDCGLLQWDIVVGPAKPTAEDRVPAPPKFGSLFSALPLSFAPTTTGPMCSVFAADARKSGLLLHVELRAFPSGFLDINARLANESAAETTKVTASVVAAWTQRDVLTREVCEDNEVRTLQPRDASSFRRGGERHLFAQRGVDWIATTWQGGAAAWLNDFAASFTLLDSSTKNSFRQPRYYGANLPQLGQQVQVVDDRLFSITEIACANIRSYRDRLADNVLPVRGDGVSFDSRIAFGPQPLSTEQIDQLLIGYAGYNDPHSTARGLELSLGVAAVRFGTSYFPYSTLGENFGALKLPGMDREGFWPLAADTVMQWPKFADDIRRDLRLLKAMGFAVVRLHHFELLGAIPPEIRQAYLDFLFGELRHLQLHALIDVFGSPESIAAVVGRYADVIEGVELENETLIWGIPLDRPEQWRAVYAAVKRAAPAVQLNLTGYNNTGIFNRLAALGVPFDRVGLHSYADSLEAIPGLRGYALALGSFASKIGKPGVITEWNWRGLARMSPEARAEVYAPIFENALATRAVPEMFQFQFNETMAPNPYAGRGNLLRHYELVHLSRRLKPEAFELMKLIRRYRAPTDPARTLEAPIAAVTLNYDGAAEGNITLANHGDTAVSVGLAAEGASGCDVTLGKAGTLTVPSRSTATIPFRFQVKQPGPGFYHAFVRYETGGQLGYAAIEARLPGRPTIDATTASAVRYAPDLAAACDLDWASPFVVVYGTEAPVPIVETAIAIAETLESATGQPIDARQVDDLTPAQRSRGTQILVGTVRDLPPVAGLLTTPAKGPVVAYARGETGPHQLAIAGHNAEAVGQAGMDFLLRYWKSAKDSAARRVGYEKRELPRGIDPAKLP